MIEEFWIAEYKKGGILYDIITLIVNDEISGCYYIDIEAHLQYYLTKNLFILRMIC